jgi:hypothetical protein
MESDIVARLRYLAETYSPLIMDSEWNEAADEIERLRKERDEARREIMSGIIDQACRSEDIDREYKKRGWEYLKENTNG